MPLFLHHVIVDFVAQVVSNEDVGVTKVVISILPGQNLNLSDIVSVIELRSPFSTYLQESSRAGTWLVSPPELVNSRVLDYQKGSVSL